MLMLNGFPPSGAYSDFCLQSGTQKYALLSENAYTKQVCPVTTYLYAVRHFPVWPDRQGNILIVVPTHNRLTETRTGQNQIMIESNEDFVTTSWSKHYNSGERKLTHLLLFWTNNYLYFLQRDRCSNHRWGQHVITIDHGKDWDGLLHSKSEIKHILL